MNCMYCSMPKDTSWAEVKLNSEKIKPVAQAVIELRLFDSISKSVTQSISRKFCKILLNYSSNLMKACWIDLKACLA